MVNFKKYVVKTLDNTNQKESINDNSRYILPSKASHPQLNKCLINAVAKTEV